MMITAGTIVQKGSGYGFAKKKTMMKPAADPAKPHQKPSHVFFGLIFGASGFLPNVFPPKNAKISLPHIIRNRVSVSQNPTDSPELSTKSRICTIIKNPAGAYIPVKRVLNHRSLKSPFEPIAIANDINNMINAKADIR